MGLRSVLKYLLDRRGHMTVGLRSKHMECNLFKSKGELGLIVEWVGYYMQMGMVNIY